MRIRRYSIEQEESGAISLVCEKQSNYSTIEKIIHPSNVYGILEDCFSVSRQVEEHTYIFALKQNGGLAGVFELSHGSMDCTFASPRDIFRRVLLVNAGSFIFAHNHPSGDPTPSEKDVVLTEKLKQASDIMEIKMVDHIVTGQGCYVSMKERGYL